VDIEAGRGEEGGETVGMDDPEGEDDTLFLGALQMMADEIDDAGEHLRGRGEGGGFRGGWFEFSHGNLRKKQMAISKWQLAGYWPSHSHGWL
jgi:hypothetical protein